MYDETVTVKCIHLQVIHRALFYSPFNKQNHECKQTKIHRSVEYRPEQHHQGYHYKKERGLYQQACQDVYQLVWTVTVCADDVACSIHVDRFEVRLHLDDDNVCDHAVYLILAVVDEGY